MNDLKLSVVMAVRNGERYLAQAIESVLAQSVTDFELLIVDDASTDYTRLILAGYRRLDSRVRVITSHVHLGLTASLNRALGHARGNVIARHDADDVSPPDRFAIQLGAFHANDDVSLVTGAVETLDERGVPGDLTIRPPQSQPRLEWELLFGNVIGAGAHVMFPRVILDEPVRFPAQYRYAQDYALWCRLCRLGRVACPVQLVYGLRQHGASISRRLKPEQDECAARVRQEYQSRFLRSAPSPAVTAGLSQFWAMADTGRRVHENTGAIIHSALAEIREAFLSYVGCRYGLDEKTRLQAELDEDTRDRLAHWLFRSVRFADARACRDLLSAAGSSRELRDVSARAFGRTVKALLRHRQRSSATVVPRRREFECSASASPSVPRWKA